MKACFRAFLILLLAVSAKAQTNLVIERSFTQFNYLVYDGTNYDVSYLIVDGCELGSNYVIQYWSPLPDNTNNWEVPMDLNKNLQYFQQVDTNDPDGSGTFYHPTEALTPNTGTGASPVFRAWSVPPVALSIALNPPAASTVTLSNLCPAMAYQLVYQLTLPDGATNYLPSFTATGVTTNFSFLAPESSRFYRAALQLGSP